MGVGHHLPNCLIMEQTLVHRDWNTRQRTQTGFVWTRCVGEPPLPFCCARCDVVGRHSLDWLDFKVQADQRKHQTLQVLHQIVEAAQAFRIFGLVDIDEGARLRGGKRDVFVANDDFQLLSTGKQTISYTAHST